MGPGEGGKKGGKKGGRPDGPTGPVSPLLVPGRPRRPPGSRASWRRGDTEHGGRREGGKRRRSPAKSAADKKKRDENKSPVKSLREDRGSPGRGKGSVAGAFAAGRRVLERRGMDRW